MPHDQCPVHDPSNWWPGDQPLGAALRGPALLHPRTSRRPPESNGNTAASLSSQYRGRNVTIINIICANLLLYHTFFIRGD